MILNLTQNQATPDQIKDGVVDLVGYPLEELKELLTFEGIPSKAFIRDKAQNIAELVDDYTQHDVDRCMIGGAPYLMGPLEDALRVYGYIPVYAFSERVSVEETGKDGSVTKRNVFKHLGFVGDRG